jgi:hypothetical protein
MRKKYKGVISGYRKAIKVIESCRDLDQLKGANNYINNFLYQYSKETNEKLGKKYLIESEEFISTAYQRLRSKYRERKEMLSL